MDAALGHDNAARRNPQQQAEGDGEAGLEAVQGAVVDADETGVERYTALFAVQYIDRKRPELIGWLRPRREHLGL